MIDTVIELGRHSYIDQWPDNEASSLSILNWESCPTDAQVFRVGNFTSIGSGLTVFIDGNHHMKYSSTFPFKERLQLERAPSSVCGKGAPRIGSDVWIGRNVTLMSGVSIGNGAVVAYGSVVTKDVPEYAVVGGNPSHVIRYRFDREIVECMKASHWWDLPDRTIFEELIPLIADPLSWAQKASEVHRRVHSAA